MPEAHEGPQKPPEALSLAEAAQLRFLEPQSLRFFRHGALLRLTIQEDRSCLKTSVLRVFPLSEPKRYFSVRDGDNKELGLIMDLDGLGKENRLLIEEELERRYLVPVIRRIVLAKERFGTVDWKVETERGPRVFTTRNLRENVTRPTPHRLILTDVDANRYDIADVEALDAQSQMWLFRHL